MDMGIGLFNGGKRMQLQYISAYLIQPIIKAIQDGINTFFLEQSVVELNVDSALHGIGTTEVDLLPKALQVSVVFF